MYLITICKVASTKWSDREQIFTYYALIGSGVAFLSVGLIIFLCLLILQYLLQ